MEIDVKVLKSESKVSKKGNPYFPAVVEFNGEVGKMFLNREVPAGPTKLSVALAPDFTSMQFAPRFEVVDKKAS